ncbi:hypothetical protein [Microlunatus antarcticus]|uniref:Transcriptional regulator, AbiEi antitoxin, Type IV TA system n=1 Tax=Microlunatus antarcticus TaxID=53388 RepID=A0A7W5JSA8_9ACTN|nr:hypothetical protein [Microlunatus antarcticus]MBB3325333.1 hypothetical protein [Microlunatus antarcticus]
MIGLLLMGGIQTTADLRSQGMGSAERARKVRSGELLHLRRGAYVEPDAVADAVARHRAMVHATVPLLADGAVVSHASAAVLHGLPLLDPPPPRVQVTRGDARAGKNRGGVHLHAAGLGEGDVVLLDGIATTALARTVVDLARSSRPESAVVTGDAALARLRSRDELDRALERSARRPGVGRARHAVGLMDGRAESAGESLSRLLIRDIRLPEGDPEPQLEVRDEHGSVIARCDFGWAGPRVVAEFDGKIKYGRRLAPGGRPERAVFDEKVREDLLRDLGWEVVRWIWADLRRPDVIAERLRRAFARAAARR